MPSARETTCDFAIHGLGFVRPSCAAIRYGHPGVRVIERVACCEAVKYFSEGSSSSIYVSHPNAFGKQLFCQSIVHQAGFWELPLHRGNGLGDRFGSKLDQNANFTVVKPLAQIIILRFSWYTIECHVDQMNRL